MGNINVNLILRMASCLIDMAQILVPKPTNHENTEKLKAEIKKELLEELKEKQ